MTDRQRRLSVLADEPRNGKTLKCQALPSSQVCDWHLQERCALCRFAAVAPRQAPPFSPGRGGCAGAGAALTIQFGSKRPPNAAAPSPLRQNAGHIQVRRQSRLAPSPLPPGWRLPSPVPESGFAKFLSRSGSSPILLQIRVPPPRSPFRRRTVLTTT